MKANKEIKREWALHHLKNFESAICDLAVHNRLSKLRDALYHDDTIEGSKELRECYGEYMIRKAIERYFNKNICNKRKKLQPENTKKYRISFYFMGGENVLDKREQRNIKEALKKAFRGEWTIPGDEMLITIDYDQQDSE